MKVMDSVAFAKYILNNYIEPEIYYIYTHRCIIFITAWGLRCGTWAFLMACGILVPRPGIEPASPALEGGILTSRLPGKSPNVYFEVCSMYDNTGSQRGPRSHTL